jgi:hypothetical protein
MLPSYFVGSGAPKPIEPSVECIAVVGTNDPATRARGIVPSFTRFQQCKNCRYRSIASPVGKISAHTSDRWDDGVVLVRNLGQSRGGRYQGYRRRQESSLRTRGWKHQ